MARCGLARVKASSSSSAAIRWRPAGPHACDRLNALQSMSQEEIKAAYKTQLRSENEAGSKGAGLGFLTVARDASEPIEFHFDEQPDGKTAMFYLKAKF